MDEAWGRIGVEINAKKNVDRGQAEVQGVTLEPTITKSVSQVLQKEPQGLGNNSLH